MTQDHLQQALSELQAALDTNAEQTPPAELDNIQGLIQQIEQQLAYPDTDAEIDTLLNQVRTHATGLEATHPKVSAILQQLIAILNNMGL
jgi:ABC-type transporter Mla subunit MlaD